MTLALISENDRHILYDAERLPQIDQRLFEPAYWQQQGRLSEPSGGRGQAFFIQHPDGSDYLLRHYRRGGLMARIIRDRYLFTGLEHSRPFQEFRLTHQLYQNGLPVPQPVAARVIRCGLWYQGDLLTVRIAGAQPFARYLQQPGREELWQRVGSTIARFHYWGLNHVDLNANNILIDDTGSAWLIDFDRCHRMPKDGNTSWQQDNLERLARSIRKLTGQDSLPDQWQTLETGYQQNL